MRRALLAGAVLVSVACAAPPAESAPADLSTIRASIDSVWAQYAAAATAGDGAGISRLYSDSVYLVETGIATVRGKAELDAAIKQVLDAVKIQESRITPEITEVMGDHVLQMGTYRDVLQATGQPAQVSAGRFAAVLRRDSTKAWRITRLIAAQDTAQPVAAKP